MSEPKTPEQSFAELRHSRDTTRKALEETQAQLETLKPRLIPEDVFTQMTQLGDPTEFLKTAVTELPALREAVKAKDSIVQEYEITASDLWKQEFTTPATQARERAMLALSNVRMDSATGKPVVTNEAYVNAAIGAIAKANTDDPVTIKAVLLTEAERLSQPPPDAASIMEVVQNIHALNKIVQNGAKIKQEWGSRKESQKAAEIARNNEARLAQLKQLTDEFATHLGALTVEGVDSDTLTAAKEKAKTRFTEAIAGPPKAGTAAEINAKAALFDTLFPDYLQWNKAQQLSGLRKQASQSSPPSVRLSPSTEPAKVPSISWEPTLATT